MCLSHAVLFNRPCLSNQDDLEIQCVPYNLNIVCCVMCCWSYVKYNNLKNDKGTWTENKQRNKVKTTTTKKQQQPNNNDAILTHQSNKILYLDCQCFLFTYAIFCIIENTSIITKSLFSGKLQNGSLIWSRKTFSKSLQVRNNNFCSTNQLIHVRYVRYWKHSGPAICLSQLTGGLIGLTALDCHTNISNGRVNGAL